MRGKDVARFSERFIGSVATRFVAITQGLPIVQDRQKSCYHFSKRNFNPSLKGTTVFAVGFVIFGEISGEYGTLLRGLAL